VDNEDTILFWEDLLVGGRTLKSRFSMLAGLTVSLRVSIGDMCRRGWGVDGEGGGGCGGGF
ncbi:hypothetical protein A2U01_0057182, partial [Trifolium medium]|nr:hypothetical protein [Trifolium medium]